MIDINQNAYVSNGEHLRDLDVVPDHTSDVLSQLLTPHVATLMIDDIIENGGIYEAQVRLPLNGRLYSVAVTEITDIVEG